MRPSNFGLSSTRFPSFYPGQEKMILDILASSARFIPLKAPTGSGKTVINWCSGKLLSDRFMYLVSTRELQSQLLRDTKQSGMFDLRGHSNYSCAGRNSNDEFQCDEYRSCQYRDAVRESLSANSVETNYAHWFVPAINDPQRFGKFDCLICDEMHLINNLVCGAVGFNISDSLLRSLGVKTEWKANLKSWNFVNFRDAAIEIRDQLFDATNNAREEKTPKYRKLLNLLQSVQRFLRDSDKIEWTVDVEHHNTLSFSPVWAAEYTERFLFRGIEKVILSSATAKESDLKRLGIPCSDTDVFEMNSAFDPKRAPIVFISRQPHIRVDNKIDEPRKRMIINRVDSLLDFHFDRGDKGIIQCTSYDWMNYLVKHSKLANRIISHQKGESRDGVLRYRSSKIPLALASPAIKEGVDLPHELCRFIIWIKIPFLNLHAKPNLSQARVKSDARYMLDETFRAFHQGSGRGNRDKKDYCVIYVLDSHWLWFKEEAGFSTHSKASFKQSVAPIELKFAA